MKPQMKCLYQVSLLNDIEDETFEKVEALPASLAGMVDLITGEAAKEGDVMNKWDVKILQEAL